MQDAKKLIEMVCIVFTVFYARQHIYYRPSVRPSVRRVVYDRKTIKVRSMKFPPYGSPIPLVFAE